ncbi:MAG: phage integrase SAM-like domain-containing protein, partial [Prevotella sp.]
MNIKFYLKEPKKAESLLLMFCRWNGNVIKLSTRHRIECKTWNAEKQQCSISKSRFSDNTNAVGENTNRFIVKLVEAIHLYIDSDCFHESTTSSSTAREYIERQIEFLVEAEKQNNDKLCQTPIEFFKEYVERKRIDIHTGRYIGERTKIHQRTVINRLESFLVDTRLPNDFSTFTSKKFDAQFTEWCYSKKNYKQNTVYATYGVLKPLLNAAKEEGFALSDTYKTLKGRCNDVDNIYLTEEEIEKIYGLNIPQLIE